MRPYIMGGPATHSLSKSVASVEQVARWRAVSSTSQADTLNQQLSDLRAQSVFPFVESLVKSQLPGMPIAVLDRALGSKSRMPGETFTLSEYPFE